jgi:DNA-binding transcriptional regulator YdaS (Cro superfamily)
MDAISKAIDLLGGVVATANVFGVSKAAVSNWKKRGVPAEHCPTIERLTDRQVTCEQLNDSIDWAYIRSTSLDEKTPA